MKPLRPVQFKADALNYFIYNITRGLFMIVPVFGWAAVINYTGQWFADRTIIEGKRLTYNASYIQSLKFTAVNTLLLVVTLGIYLYWFMPKLYSYLADHLSYTTDAEPFAPVTLAGAAKSKLQSKPKRKK